MLICAAGCQNGSVEKSLWAQLKEQGQKEVDLRLKTEQCQAENKELKDRIETLCSIGPGKRIEAFAELERVEIGRRTGMFDNDRDGKVETLIVYIKPIDTAGDSFKAPGHINVQLWNLDAPAEKAKLDEWDIEPVSLKKLWVGTFMAYYYRLTFDISAFTVDIGKGLTVKIAFTDYVTGRVFSEQMVIAH
jgi:hypothetical protein